MSPAAVSLLVAVVQSIAVVDADRAIDAGGSRHPLTEPHVAAHPQRPGHVVVGAIASSAERDGPWHCAAFATLDGGETWTRHDFAMERCIDPWVVLFEDGRALLAAIEIRDDAAGDERFRLVLFESLDGGVNWSGDPADLGRAHDHELLLPTARREVLLVSRRMRRNASGEPRHSIHLARSSDGGRSFEKAAEYLPSNLALNATGLALLPDGVAAVSYIDFQRNVDGFDREGVLRSPRAWLLRLAPGDTAFSEPRFVTESCGMRGGFPGYPFLAADPAGRLYHVCIRSGFEGLALTRSLDGGEHWSEDVVLESPHARTPMLAASAAGVVAVAWYDRRNDPERACQDVYFSASTDGGQSFHEPVRVSTETSCPAAPGNGAASDRWPSGGDYSSMVAEADGRFRIVWADSRSGVFSLRTAVLAVER